MTGVGYGDELHGERALDAAHRVRSNVRRTDLTLLVVLAAMTLTGIRAAEPAQPGAISTIACYVALANDLTPLVDATLPDFVAESPECVSQMGTDDDKNRGGNVTRSKMGNRKGATTRPPPAPTNVDLRTNSSAAPPSASLKSTDQGSSQQ
jgi:hypothetical protein